MEVCRSPLPSPSDAAAKQKDIDELIELTVFVKVCVAL